MQLPIGRKSVKGMCVHAIKISLYDVYNRGRCAKQGSAAALLQALAAGNHLHLIPLKCRCVRLVWRLNQPYLSWSASLTKGMGAGG